MTHRWRGLARYAFLIFNLGLMAAVVTAGALAPVPALGAAAALAAIEVWFWWTLLHRQDAQSPQQALRIITRSAAARRDSIRDETTGLFNRWYLERRLEEEAARCRRYGYSMAVLVIKAGAPHLADLSEDKWQQRTVDAAQRCMRVVRVVDLSAYLAPMEFAICLVHCDYEGAQRALQRLTEELSEYTCLGGIAVYPGDGCEPRELIELARSQLRLGAGLLRAS